MSEDIYTQFLRFSVTESAAGTLTEGDAVLTGCSIARVSGEGNIAMEIHAILVDSSEPTDAPATNSWEYVRSCLSTRTGLTVMPQVDEEHVIHKNANGKYAGVATYLPVAIDRDMHMPHYTRFSHPVLVSHPKIYPYIQSSNTTTPATCYYVIEYTYVLITPEVAIEALEAFR